MAIALYARKSIERENSISCETQIEYCKSVIKPDERSEKTIEFIDNGYSGGNVDRDGFQKMMHQIERGKIGKVIVYRLDRISRNISDFASLIEELARLDISFVSIKEQFDTSTPMGRAMMYIASVFSQLERETIAERIRDNMHELAKTGRWLGGTTPTALNPKL